MGTYDFNPNSRHTHRIPVRSRRAPSATGTNLPPPQSSRATFIYHAPNSDSSAVLPLKHLLPPRPIPSCLPHSIFHARILSPYPPRYDHFPRLLSTLYLTNHQNRPEPSLPWRYQALRSPEFGSPDLYGIDLFAGLGGMSLGATLSGVAVRTAIERDQNAAASYAHNHPATDLIVSDVASLSANSIRAFAQQANDLVIFGGPPCQGFSYSNPRHRKKTNPSNWLFQQFLRYTSILQPAWVVFENVRGLKDTANGYFLRRVLSGLGSLGFHLAHGVLNALDFGVPQNRGRYFIVGNRIQPHYQLPKSLHSSKITVGDAFRDLPDLQNGNSTDLLPYGNDVPSPYGRHMRGDRRFCTNNLVSRNSHLVVERYRHVPPGGNWKHIPLNLMHNYRSASKCHTGIYHRLHHNRPATVVGNFRKNMLIHPTQDRGLSVREAARLQSFPDSYQVYGSIGFQQQQVGNAVPPLLAKAVFRSIIDSHIAR